MFPKCQLATSKPISTLLLFLTIILFLDSVTPLGFGGILGGTGGGACSTSSCNCQPVAQQAPPPVPVCSPQLPPPPAPLCAPAFPALPTLPPLQPLQFPQLQLPTFGNSFGCSSCSSNVAAAPLPPPPPPPPAATLCSSGCCGSSSANCNPPNNNQAAYANNNRHNNNNNNQGGYSEKF
ncbi:unnamed protein product [Meloidogyne enterolobii]|uniref:Uncharacterized protein n=1 Tax=Meloidogyne enterolobii TaxID=390850 RepID=A0ACB1B4F8_MELEN